MTIRELLARVEAELKQRREQYYDDPRNSSHNCETNETITVLRETAELIRSEFPV